MTVSISWLLVVLVLLSAALIIASASLPRPNGWVVLVLALLALLVALTQRL